MERIGVRELRQHASAWLRRVRAGESFEITDRGQPVARIVPAANGTGFAALVAEGRVAAADGDLLELGPPLDPQPGIPRASEVLEQLRADER
jgi:prevent-host-death family protein